MFILYINVNINANLYKHFYLSLLRLVDNFLFYVLQQYIVKNSYY